MTISRVRGAYHAAQIQRRRQFRQRAQPNAVESWAAQPVRFHEAPHQPAMDVPDRDGIEWAGKLAKSLGAKAR
jgi:hypothetical protein